MIQNMLKNYHHLLEILIHFLCWGMFFGFPLFFIQSADRTIDWNSFLIHTIVPTSFLIVFYTNYFLFIPHILFRDHIKRFLFINFIFICFLSFLMRCWSNVLFPIENELNRPEPPQYIFYLRDMTSLIFCAGLSVAIRMSIRWRKAENDRREAIKSRTEAELKNLRNQLNPHFLLNTLNNIYALIAFDTEKAQQAVQELSKLLRYILYDNQQLFVPLNKEIVEDALRFIKEGDICDLAFYKGNAFSCDPQNFVELEVIDAEPGIPGATAQPGSKSATLETGYVIQVPLFVNAGEKIRVDTRDGTYMSRV